MTIGRRHTESVPASPPRVVGASGEPVWALARDLLSGVQPCDLLDVAAGGGSFASDLASRGFTVTGLDMVDQWQVPSIPFVLADVDGPLPFDSSSFGAVTWIEALGYVDNPSHVLREVHRVLKPGGVAVITVPNVLSLQSRTRFLLNGTYRWFPHPPYAGEDKPDLCDVYRDPIRLTTLWFHLQRAGFEIESTRFGGQTRCVALAPFGLLLQAMTFVHNALRSNPRRHTPSIVNSFPALLKTNVGVLARKTS